MTLKELGVRMDGRELQIHTSPDDFALRKHNPVQAMLAVNEMFYLIVSMVVGLFYEDMVTSLDVHDIRYTPRGKFTGKTRYDHIFDFVIPSSRRQSERIVQKINLPNRDTREVRSPESRAYALLNDSEHSVSSPAEEALRSNEVRPVPWSQREHVLEELAA